MQIRQKQAAHCGVWIAQKYPPRSSPAPLGLCTGESGKGKFSFSKSFVEQWKKKKITPGQRAGGSDPPNTFPGRAWVPALHKEELQSRAGSARAPSGDHLLLHSIPASPLLLPPASFEPLRFPKEPAKKMGRFYFFFFFLPPELFVQISLQLRGKPSPVCRESTMQSAVLIWIFSWRFPCRQMLKGITRGWRHWEWRTFAPRPAQTGLCDGSEFFFPAKVRINTWESQFSCLDSVFIISYLFSDPRAVSCNQQIREMR